MDKTKIIAALDKWIRQRPGLDYGNYGDPVSYRAEARSIAKDRREAQTLLRAVELRDGITGDAIVHASERAFCGRLSIKPHGAGGVRLDYCTGQYWPTEYRRAACAVLASALWDYWRDNMPQGEEWDRIVRTGATPGSYLRDRAVQEFGRTIGRRWFN